METFKWIDVEEQLPSSEGYYLCNVWEETGCEYFPVVVYEVAYYRADEKAFEGRYRKYPFIGKDNSGRICETYKVTHWAEIPKISHVEKTHKGDL